MDYNLLFSVKVCMNEMSLSVNVKKMVPYTITLLYDTCNMHLLKILHTVTLTKSLVFSLCILVYKIQYICIILHIIPKSVVNILMSEVQIIMDVYQYLYK